VPPDQSGTVSPAAMMARSASRSRIARVTRVSRVPIVKTSVPRPVDPVGAPVDTTNLWASRSSASA